MKQAKTRRTVARKSTDTRNTLLAEKYAVDFSVPVEVAQIVAHRYPQYEDAKAYLFPDIGQLHDPQLLPDIKDATHMIMEALRKKEPVLIYTHDDIDGYTSAAIMYKTLRDLYRTEEQSVFVYPIIREKDGYIINRNVLEEYKENGVRHVVTVDFGISSEDNFRIVKEVGLNLVVCDHHETVDVAFPVPAVDPKRPDSRYPFRELAGVGVSFKLAQSLYQDVFKLRAGEFYNLKKDFLPLVMVGTISDKVALCGENRALCIEGLRVFNRTDDGWVKHFRHEHEFSFGTISSTVIPTLASAAYDDPNLGVQLLIRTNKQFIDETITRLTVITKERRREVALHLEDAIAAAKVYPEIVVSIIPFSKPHYLGSIAARLRDQYKRTSAVIGIKDGKCFGEFRSNSVHLYNMLYSFRTLFLDFGGHPRAAGCTIVEENLDRVVQHVVEYVTARHDELAEPHSISGQPEAQLARTDVSKLQILVPFGEGNPPPLLTDGECHYTVDNDLRIIEKAKKGTVTSS
jgi:single-stranded-DNA-specific exonuclease